MHEPNQAWYAIWTKSRHEQLVREQLEQKGYDAFLPTVTRVMRWKDRKKKVDWPLFPGYCFGHFHRDERLQVLTCSGVVNIVAFNGEIAPVEDYEIESIRLLIAAHLPHDPCPLIHEGMAVEVVHGPLAGARGCLVRKGRQDRLVVAVEMIGQAVSVEIDAADVKVLA
jgi:transcriptional antiterminator NusG